MIGRVQEDPTSPGSTAAAVKERRAAEQSGSKAARKPGSNAEREPGSRTANAPRGAPCGTGKNSYGVNLGVRKLHFERDLQARATNPRILRKRSERDRRGP